MNLEDWPRPPEDNGRGIHFGNVTERALDKYLGLLKELQVQWVVLASESNENIGKVATGLLAEGIMPIARPQRPINQPADFGYLAESCKSPYVQIYNEFGDDREWRDHRRPEDWWEYSQDKWIRKAHQVRSVGCFPGLQVMSLDELYDILNLMIESGDSDLFSDMWLSLHLYPPLGCPPSCTEHGELDVLAWRLYDELCHEITGRHMPIIVTESAWTPSQALSGVRAEWMVEVYEWFKRGSANLWMGGHDREGYYKELTQIPVPDHFLAFCPWILFSKFWFGFSWADNIEHQPMVEAVKAMPPFVRGEPESPPEEEKDWRVVGHWMEQRMATDLLCSLDDVDLGGFFDLEGRDGLSNM